MRIYNARTMRHSTQVTQLLNTIDTYFHICMRIYRRIDIHDLTGGVTRVCVVCVYAHAHAQGDVAYR